MSRLCEFLAPNVEPMRLNNVLAVAYALNSQVTDGKSLGLPLFPLDSMVHAVRVWNNNPSYPESYIVELCYPKNTILKRDDQQPVLEDIFKKFSIQKADKELPSRISEVSPENDSAATVKATCLSVGAS
ncbi:von Willebrand factor A domain containing 8 [Aphelenchoides avenae]|nr:von Willebrand factor A domain containing 8 [Aphelenchus avenae]